MAALSFLTVEPIHAECLAAKEQSGGKRLPVRRSREISRHFTAFREWASQDKKAAMSIPIHRRRMPPVMKSKITTHPIDMGIPCAYAVVQRAKVLAPRVEFLRGQKIRQLGDAAFHGYFSNG